MKIVNIIDIDEIPPSLTGAINNRTVTLKHPNDEGAHDRRNDSPPILRRSVYIEVAENGDIHIIKLAVAFAKCSSAVLTSGIDPNRSDLFFACGKLIDTFILS